MPSPETNPAERIRPWQFKPGQSGNPLGPRKKLKLALLAQVIHERTGSCVEVVDFYRQVMHGALGATIPERMEAANWLVKYGVGEALPEAPEFEEN